MDGFLTEPGEDYLRELYAEYQKSGAVAFERMRDESPHKYVWAIAELIRNYTIETP